MVKERTRRILWRAGAVLVLLFGAFLALGFLGTKTLENGPSGKGAAKERGARIGSGPEWLEGYLPNFLLTNEERKEARFYDELIKGKIVLINFMMIKCAGICSGTTANLVKVQRILGDRVGRDIFMYSITLDPANDTPEELKKYAASYQVKPGWHFLTGKSQELEKIRRRLGLYDPDPKVDADKTQHTGLVLYGNAALSMWKTISGQRAAEDIADAVLSVETPPGSK
jgi:protein SCO1/2